MPARACPDQRRGAPPARPALIAATNGRAAARPGAGPPGASSARQDLPHRWGPMPIVVIDAGHGGQRDAGRSTWGGANQVEKEVTLELARRVAQEMGAEARLTRARDVNLSLAERCAVARRLGAAAFVSIHAHEGEQTAQTFVHGRASASSRALARSLATNVRAAEMAVLTPERLAPGTAACLLEVP